MDYFIPAHIKGRTETGVPYEFFRGIHHVPDALADSHEANALGIVPVEEMMDEDWRLLGLNKEAWIKANRPKVDGPAEDEAPAEPAVVEPDKPPAVESAVPAPAVIPAKPLPSPVAALSPVPAPVVVPSTVKPV